MLTDIRESGQFSICVAFSQWVSIKILIICLNCFPFQHKYVHKSNLTQMSSKLAIHLLCYCLRSTPHLMQTNMMYCTSCPIFFLNKLNFGGRNSDSAWAKMYDLVPGTKIIEFAQVWRKLSRKVIFMVEMAALLKNVAHKSRRQFSQICFLRFQLQWFL